MEENKVKIRTFFSRFFKDRDLRDDEDIFATGHVNSLVAMQLVLFVEGEFGIAVGDEDLDIDNFSSVNAIAHLVGRKSAQRSEV
jgi:acyl carrier protein